MPTASPQWVNKIARVKEWETENKMYNLFCERAIELGSMSKEKAIAHNQK